MENTDLKCIENLNKDCLPDKPKLYNNLDTMASPTSQRYMEKLQVCRKYSYSELICTTNRKSHFVIFIGNLL